MAVTLPRWAVHAVVLAFLGPGCADHSARLSPRLVVLFIPCTVSASFLGPYNPEVAYTPNLSALAERSVVFQRHRTEAGQSGISFASLLSGAPTAHHGVYINETELPDSLELIFETYGANGYDVFAWFKHSVPWSFNHAQGVPKENLSRGLLMAQTPGFQKILSDLRRDPAYRALIVTGFTVTHGPYGKMFVNEFCKRYPSECAALDDREQFNHYLSLYYDRANYRPLSFDFPNTVKRLGFSEDRIQQLANALELAYKSNIYHLDRIFGELVRAVDSAEIFEESLIALVADHGEVLYRDNLLFPWTHGLNLAPETLNAPFILLGPQFLEGPRVYEGVTRAIDVFPTLAGLSGLAAPARPGFGRDISAAVLGEEPPPNLLAFSYSPVV